MGGVQPRPNNAMTVKSCRSFNISVDLQIHTGGELAALTEQTSYPSLISSVTGWKQGCLGRYLVRGRVASALAN
jgi:hypothetical protein